MTSNNPPKLTPSEKEQDSAYDQTKDLIGKTEQSGLLSPLMNMLNGLLEDPVLKETLKNSPANSANNKKS